MSAVSRKLESREEILRWLQDESKRKAVSVVLHPEAVREEDEFLYLPVGAPGDALAVASILQDLEDGWNNREPEPARRLLLVPTTD